MAFGTPVAAAAAYSAQNGTSVTPAYPAGILATDVVLLFVGQKPSTANSGTVTTPTGWTLREEITGAGGYGTTLGADTGNTNLRIYSWNTPVAGQTGTLSVTLGVNNISWAFMVRVPTGGGALSYGSADGSRTTAPTAGTPFSVTLTNGASPTAFETGDVAIWAMCIPTDVTTPGQFSAQDITATGAVFGTPIELNEPDSATGNDIGGYSAWGNVDSGSSTTAPVVTVTAGGTATNVRGPVALIRLREIAALTLNAEPTSYSITGSDATLLEDRSLNAEPASYAITGADAMLMQEATFNAEPGSYALTGFAATLVEDRNLNAEPANYALTGANATLSKELMVNAEPGSYALTGSNATLEKQINLNAESGSYAVIGVAATFEIIGAGKELIAETGTYTVTGVEAMLMRQVVFNAETGAYVVTGSPAEFSKGLSLNAESAAYDITGFSADIKKQSAVSADSGAYNLTGSNAILGKGLILNAEPATEYVEPGYVDPGYVIQTGYYVNGFPVTFKYPVFPLPNQVLAGVVYGPNGNDFVGTYVCPPGTSKQILYVFDD